MTQSSVVANLPLPAGLARGLVVSNNQAVIAMGEAGVGMVDVYLHTKAYLNGTITLPHGHAALDVARLSTDAGEPSRYVVAAAESAVPAGANTQTLRVARAKDISPELMQITASFIFVATSSTGFPPPNSPLSLKLSPGPEMGIGGVLFFRMEQNSQV